ncbi:hypothetical protein [Tenacibaculum piscium]|uniref:Uncharacterized protein n=2 Tax=Tenacibaculum piscium TaxID=1458515 RepID=A0A2H1YJT3_9FLAO|nr:hypothetical protein [Tenacibaculum piscium]MBE7629449.1 hypothetical protein [Tenacibaculum piscium]SOS75755.1 conserved membrane hypothetical protein [Tenacibaculum piscium]
MTVYDLINILTTNSSNILNYYILLFVIVLIGLLFSNMIRPKSPILYVYSALIYAIAIPGLLSIILVVYNFFFLRKNLMQLQLVTYYLPIIAMVLLFLIIKKTLPLKEIPGFDKLSGLFIILFITFLITYFIQKAIIGVFFIGSFTQLIAIFLVLLVVLKLGWNKLVK